MSVEEMSHAHWLHSLLPDLPRYGFAIAFIVVFLNNLGVPMTRKTILLAAGFILGKNDGSLWQSIAAGTAGCFLGGICTFLAWTAVGPRQPRPRGSSGAIWRPYLGASQTAATDLGRGKVCGDIGDLEWQERN
jgi:membrane protein DedA with SNARE-associated domain